MSSTVACWIRKGTYGPLPGSTVDIMATAFPGPDSIFATLKIIPRLRFGKMNRTALKEGA